MILAFRPSMSLKSKTDCLNSLTEISLRKKILENEAQTRIFRTENNVAGKIDSAGFSNGFTRCSDG